MDETGSRAIIEKYVVHISDADRTPLFIPHYIGYIFNDLFKRAPILPQHIKSLASFSLSLLSAQRYNDLAPRQAMDRLYQVLPMLAAQNVQ